MLILHFMYKSLGQKLQVRFCELIADNRTESTCAKFNHSLHLLCIESVYCILRFQKAFAERQILGGINA